MTLAIDESPLELGIVLLSAKTAGLSSRPSWNNRKQNSPSVGLFTH